MPDRFTPQPEDHFTFGLWTVGNPGRDPFGHEVRAPLDPVDSVKHLAGVGAYGVSFHDDDLVPPGSSASERDAIVARFRGALDETGLRVSSSLHWVHCARTDKYTLVICHPRRGRKGMAALGVIEGKYLRLF